MLIQVALVAREKIEKEGVISILYMDTKRNMHQKVIKFDDLSEHISYQLLPRVRVGRIKKKAGNQNIWESTEPL